MPRPRTRVACSDCGGWPRLNEWVLSDGSKALTIACRRCGRETEQYPASAAHLAEAAWGRMNCRRRNHLAALVALRGHPVVVLVGGQVSASVRGVLDEVTSGGEWEVLPAPGSVLRFTTMSVGSVEANCIRVTCSRKKAPDR